MINLGHGANSAEMAALYGKKQEELIDFSSNINPFMSEHLVNSVQSALKSCQNYPDIHYTKLRQVLSQYLSCEMKQIIPGNGATEIMYLLMKTLGESSRQKEEPFRLGIINPTFSEYERSAKLNGLEIVPFQLKASTEFDLEVEKLKARLHQIDGLFICNPNNPTGNSYSLASIAKQMEEMQKLLIVDETFMEFVEEEAKYSLIPLVQCNNQLIIIKAVTKFFGLPGLRLGYGVTSNKALLRGMYHFKEPWTVNGFAEYLTPILLEDKVFQKKTKAYFKEERNHLLEALRTLPNIKVYATTTNYILIELKTMTSQELKEQMIIKYNILIRDASNFKGLNKHFIRVAIKGKADNDKLLKAMWEIVG